MKTVWVGGSTIYTCTTALLRATVPASTGALASIDEVPTIDIYGVCLFIGEPHQSVAGSVATINIHTVTAASSSSVGDPVASGISQWRGRNPGHSDTSGTSLDCCHITGG